MSDLYSRQSAEARGLCVCGLFSCTNRHPYRVQMTSQHQIVADEMFDSFAEAEDFVFWWHRQDDLPKATALQARADVDGPRWHLPPQVELNYTLEPNVRERFTASRELAVSTRTRWGCCDVDDCNCQTFATGDE